MNPILELHSPKQAAKVLGVSESSLKRWCDRGMLQTTRTGGGHRKVVTAELIRFARERGMTLVTPELLGLPPVTSTIESQMQKTASALAESLLVGNDSLSRQLVLNLMMHGHALPRVFDEVIAEALVEIGELWTCERVDIFQERRSCETVHRILAEISKSQPAPTSTLTAIGGTVSGNAYSLQTLMAEIVLCDCGFQAKSLGTGIPFDSLIRAIEQLRPTLFWLSSTFIEDEDEFLSGFAKLSAICAETQSALVIGGRALTPAFRETLAEATYCDNMQQLAVFARTIARIHQRSLAAGSPVTK